MTRVFEVDRGVLIRILIVVSVSVLLVLITGARFFYLTTALLLGVLLVNGLILWTNILLLVSTFHISASVLTAGETLTIQYRLLNNSILPIFHLSVKPVISKELGEVEFDFRHYAFRPYEIQEIERHLRCDRRGFYTAGEIVMKLSDPLKLMTWTMTRLKPIEVAVYPRVYPYRKPKLEAVELFGARRSSDQRKEDQTSVKSVRKYHEGDSARSIHWALTAKMAELQVKEYSNASSKKTYVFADGYESPQIAESPSEAKASALRFDGIAEVAASILTGLLREGTETVMLINDRHRTEAHGRQYRHLGLFMDKLIAFLPDGPLAFPEFLSRESRRFQEGAELIVICGPLDPVMQETLRGLVKRHFRVICYSLDPEWDAIDPHQTNGLTLSLQTVKNLQIFRLSEASALSKL